MSDKAYFFFLEKGSNKNQKQGLFHGRVQVHPKTMSSDFGKYNNFSNFDNLSNTNHKIEYKGNENSENPL